jgi:hypothetical protein
MRFASIRQRMLSVSWLVGLMVAGCDPSPGVNLSPTSEQDLGRFEKAVRAIEAKVLEDQEAERKAFQAKGRSAPAL